MLKSELRKIYLAKQKSLSEVERNEKSRQIANLFFQSFDLNDVNFLHCFLPIEKFREVNTKLIFEKLREIFPNVSTLVPRVNFQTGEIENLIFSAETKLVQSVWQIDEPDHDECVETKKIDLILVPLLCCDAKGFRVGYGKGFYDKFLKNCRRDCLKIGLSYFAPIAEISNAEAHDIKLNYCVTPDKIYKFE
jgi:5-formyltetrahydrofolate cyclo-ligase